MLLHFKIKQLKVLLIFLFIKDKKPTDNANIHRFSYENID